MIDRPLEENEEIVGDKIAGLFYSVAPVDGKITDKAREITSTSISEPEIKQYVLDTTIGRLYSEKTNRIDYLVKKLNIKPKDDESLETALHNTDRSSLSPEDAEQYSYFRVLSDNLYLYELETWAEEQSSILGVLLKQSPERLKKTSEILKEFANKVTTVRDPQQYLSALLPDATLQALKELGLSQAISRFQTIIDEATYCRYIGNLAELVSGELERGTPKEDISTIAAAATIRYKPLLIS